MKTSLVKVFFAVIFSVVLVACGKTNSTESTTTTPEVTVVDFATKLSAARKAESAFEAALAAAPDLATAKASPEFAAMQKAMEEAKAAAQTDAEKADVANVQKLIDILVNQ
jgi:hypothetical protein